MESDRTLSVRSVEVKVVDRDLDDVIERKARVWVEKASDEQLISEFERRSLVSPRAKKAEEHRIGIIVEQRDKAEEAMRMRDLVVTYSTSSSTPCWAIEKATDEQLRAECERRKIATPTHLDMVSMASRKHNELSFMTTERDEWKSRAEAAEKFRDSQQVVLEAGRSAARNLAEVTRVCGLYGLPVGVNALTWLEASLRIAAGARERVNKRESIEAEHTPDSGRGLAQLHFERPRPDNSVAHLDVDLLADDAP